MKRGKPREIAPGLYLLGSDLVNWFLVEADGGLTAVDAGLPAFARSLEADLAAAGVRADDVQAVVLTHSDADHTGLAPAFRERGARILIHESDEPTLRNPGPKSGDAAPRRLLPFMRHRAFWQSAAGMMRGGAAKPPKITGAETFGDGDVLDVPGSPRVVHMPGHTPGHCAFHFERRRALFVGDGLRTRDPFTGREGMGVMDAGNVSNAQARASLERLEALDADLVLCGHGDPWPGDPAAAVATARG